MGFKAVELKLRTDYNPEELQNTIKKVLKLQNFTYQIEKQRLDGRNPDEIHWVVRVGVVSPEIYNYVEPQADKPLITKKKTDKHILIVGSNHEGFYAAMDAQEAGFKVAVIEQGTEVYQRTKDIKDFEKMEFTFKSVFEIDIELGDITINRNEFFDNRFKDKLLNFVPHPGWVNHIEI